MKNSTYNITINKNIKLQGNGNPCYANSDIYNSVFVNNSAHRDGGAIRASVFGYGNVEDCIFIYNHVDEWGGA